MALTVAPVHGAAYELAASRRRMARDHSHRLNRLNGITADMAPLHGHRNAADDCVPAEVLRALPRPNAIPGVRRLHLRPATGIGPRYEAR